MTSFPPLEILFICTGNICRSPLALQLLDKALAPIDDKAPRPSVLLQSRGTHARAGAPMDPQSAKQSESRHADPSGHLAAQLTPADLRRADLVVTMTLEQRASAARLLPAASKRSVTLVELARLIEHVSAEGETGTPTGDPRRRLELLLAQRSLVPQARREEDLNIPDPYGRSAGTHARVARLIESSVAPLAEWLSVAPPGVEETGRPSTRRELRARRESDQVPQTRREARARRDRGQPEG